jgi:serine/threonine protein kinase
LKQLSISPNQISINQSEDGLVGRGAFGEVTRGRYGTQDVAIKVIQSGGRGLTDNEKTTIENEVLLMAHCHFPLILQLYGYCQVDARTVYLALEFCPSGSLWSYLDNKVNHPSIPPNSSLAWISDIFSALKHLHDRGIIHRDVKAENVLLAEGLFCKLTSFQQTTNGIQFGKTVNECSRNIAVHGS